MADVKRSTGSAEQGIIDEDVSNQEPWYCIHCGAQLAAGQRYCGHCGAARWDPPAEENLAPSPAQPATSATTAVSLGSLPAIYAMGAIWFLVMATLALATLVSPHGRGQVVGPNASLASPAHLLILFAFELIVLPVMLAVLHGVAYYGLRRTARWGWLAAVVVAGCWSLVLLGIPVLIRLLQADIRRAFRVG
jgi:hypothetical protein